MYKVENEMLLQVLDSGHGKEGFVRLHSQRLT